MPVKAQVMCCNHLCPTVSSICSDPSHQSVIFEWFSAEEGSKLVTDLKSLLEEWKVRQLRLTANIGEQPQVHTAWQVQSETKEGTLAEKPGIVIILYCKNLLNRFH